MTNKYIIGIFVVLLFLCIVSSVYSACWDIFNKDTTNPYLLWNLEESVLQNNFWLKLVTSFGQWMLNFTNLVPISLLVTLEVVKFMQAVFIGWDHLMYDVSLDQGAKAQSSNLNEELG